MKYAKLTDKEAQPRAPVLDSMPPGWKQVPDGSLTEPLGHVWIYNGKNPFDEDLQLALLRLK